MSTSSLGRSSAVVFTIILTIVTTAQWPATPAGATMPGANGRIAFSRRGGPWAVLTIDPDGSGVRRVVGGWDPAWSPNGRRIAVVWCCQPIMVVNPDGSGLRTLVGSSHNDKVTWSPDGSQIAFTVSVYNHLGAPERTSSEIWVINTDGTGLRKLTTGGAFWSSWSPNGRRIAFSSFRGGTSDIWSIDLNGTGLRRLTHARAWDAEPAWSPDGTMIAFSSNRTGTRKIWTIRADGSDPRQVTWSVAAADVSPDWQPLPRSHG